MTPALTGGVQEAGEPSPEAAPLIQRIQPAQGARGVEIDVTINGENFSRGVYVSFVNPAVH